MPLPEEINMRGIRRRLVRAEAGEQEVLFLADQQAIFNAIPSLDLPDLDCCR